jgi:exonuclease III
VRIVAWNIRAGGGVRGVALAAQLRRFGPDVAALSEFRATPPSLALALALAALGLRHQLTTTDAATPNANALLLASRWPLARLGVPRGPDEPGRFVLARVEGPRPFCIGAMHVPNRISGRKWPFLDAVLRLARRWRGGPALLVGDTNSGVPGIDEESAAFNAREGGWIEAMERAGWRDAFRHRRGAARAYTWYSPNGGNGFRIDQAFVNPEMLPRLTGVRHDWGRAGRLGGRAAGLSDHAAVVVDFGSGPTGSARATVAAGALGTARSLSETTQQHDVVERRPRGGESHARDGALERRRTRRNPRSPGGWGAEPPSTLERLAPRRNPWSSRVARRGRPARAAAATITRFAG